MGELIGISVGLVALIAILLIIAKEFNE